MTFGLRRHYGWILAKRENLSMLLCLCAPIVLCLLFSIELLESFRLWLTPKIGKKQSVLRQTSSKTEINTLPGSTEVFTLEKYKEDLGKTYARIPLFLCPLVDTSDSEPEREPELEPEQTWSDLESDDWLNDIPDIFQGNHYKYLFLLRSVSKTWIYNNI